MSILIKASLLSNKFKAKVFAVSVFQTQVGHRNKKLQRGLFSSFNQEAALFIAFATELIALSCHTTDFFKYSSKCNNLSFSVCTSFETGTHVHFEIISAISSLSTLSLKYDFHDFLISSNDFSISNISFSASGISQ
jgi:hypothetical protein